MRCRVANYTTPGSAFFIQATGESRGERPQGLGRERRSRDLSYKGKAVRRLEHKGEDLSYKAYQIQRSCVNSSVCVTNSG
jgi:hypothetical protein